MITQGARELARIKLGGACITTVTMCNNLSEKYSGICDKLMAECDKIQKRYPKRYCFMKEWIKKWREYLIHIRRWEYYTSIAQRNLDESQEYLKAR